MPLPLERLLSDGMPGDSGRPSRSASAAHPRRLEASGASEPCRLPISRQRDMEGQETCAPVSMRLHPLRCQLRCVDAALELRAAQDADARCFRAMPTKDGLGIALVDGGVAPLARVALAAGLAT